MNSLNDFFRAFTEIVPSSYTFTINEVLVVLALSFVLSLIIGKVYSATHNGVSYSQNFVHTLIMLSMVVSSVMLIVGSNIARAFTLLGALSIVRFRNAIKETRDVGYVFFVMAVGMACGTRFYPMAIVMTVVICLAQILLIMMHFGQKNKKQSLLKVILPTTADNQKLVSPVLKKHLARYSLVNIEPTAENLNELNYVVSYRRKTDESKLLNEIRATDQNCKVSIIHGDRAVEV